VSCFPINYSKLGVCFIHTFTLEFCVTQQAEVFFKFPGKPLIGAGEFETISTCGQAVSGKRLELPKALSICAIVSTIRSRVSIMG